ncbi:hypothetical protein D0Y65_015745, partial [Glycine soja]
MEGFFPKSCLRVDIYAEFFGSWGHYNCLSYGFTHFLDLRRKQSIRKSLNQMAEEESGLPIVNLHASHCAVMNLGLQFNFFVL